MISEAWTFLNVFSISRIFFLEKKSQRLEINIIRFICSFYSIFYGLLAEENPVIAVEAEPTTKKKVRIIVSKMPPKPGQQQRLVTAESQELKFYSDKLPQMKETKMSLVKAAPETCKLLHLILWFILLSYNLPYSIVDPIV